MRKSIGVALMFAVMLGFASVPVRAQMQDSKMHDKMQDGKMHDNKMHDQMMMQNTSTPFQGAKANKGTVSYSKEGGKITLTLSDDFVVPETPDPHWRVVDSDGVTYDLAKLKVKNDGYNKSIVLPKYVKNVVKVVIWCAWAETSLGEASFAKPVM